MELSNLLQRYRGTPGRGQCGMERGGRTAALDAGAGGAAITEELWSRLAAARGEEWASIHTQPWPTVDSRPPPRTSTRSRSRSTASSATASRSGRDRRAELERLVLARPKVVAALDGKQPLKVIHAGGKLVNIVVR